MEIKNVVIGRVSSWRGSMEMESIECRIEQRDRLTNVMSDEHLHRTAVGCCRIGEVERMQGEVGLGRAPAPL